MVIHLKGKTPHIHPLPLILSCQRAWRRRRSMILYKDYVRIFCYVFVTQVLYCDTHTHRHTRTYASHMTNRVENFYVDEQCTFYGWEAPSIDIFLI